METKGLLERSPGYYIDENYEKSPLTSRKKMVVSVLARTQESCQVCGGHDRVREKEGIAGHLN